MSVRPEKVVDPFYSSNAWRNLAKAARKRDGHRCRQCGVSVLAKGTSQVDHIKARREYPELALVLWNVRTLCTGCHNARHQHERRAAMRGGRPAPTEAIGVDGLPDSWRV
jgi:5-methylcytosine-specific restriction endonuclease McrA